MNATTTDVRFFLRFTKRCLATSLLMSLAIGCVIWLTLSAIVSGSDLPPVPVGNPVPSTNRYHLACTWDAVSDAAGYQMIVRHSGVETQRISTVTNWVVISNLTSDLDNYRFTCIATNIISVSGESEHAPLRLIIIMDQDRSISFEPTNSALFFTNLHPVAISRWDAAALLKPD